MNLIMVMLKKVRLMIYNNLHATKLKSIYASLSAKYGKAVRIDKGTRVSSDVVIGDFSYVNANSSIENCDIGKYCSISSGVHISPYNHNMYGLTTHPIGDYARSRDKVVIGNDVLISLNVIILEGVHIGDGAIIGAGAVVTHNVGPYEIWGGVPARLIHYRVKDKKQRDALINLKWWDQDKKHLLVEKYKYHLDGIEDE